MILEVFSVLNNSIIVKTSSFKKVCKKKGGKDPCHSDVAAKHYSYLNNQMLLQTLCEWKCLLFKTRL